MPGNEHNAKYLATFAQFAPKLHAEMIKAVARNYKLGKIKNFKEAERVVSLLSHKSPVFRKQGKAQQAYLQLMRKAGLIEPPAPAEPPGETVPERLKAAKKRKTDNHNVRLLTVILYTTPEKSQKAEAKGLVEDNLDKQDHYRYRKFLNKRWKGLRQIWKGQLATFGGSDNFMDTVENKLIRHGEKYWRRLYRICLTDPSFKKREVNAPGYVEAIYILENHQPEETGTGDGDVDPRESAKRVAGQKLTIDYKYTCNTLDLSKDTFEEAIKMERYQKDECWINALYDFYGDNLLSMDKKRNMINRETILQTLGKTEDSVKKGLTIKEIVPFFEKYKLKLRVYDRFYRKLFAYDPVVPNFNNRPMHVLVDGDHVYTLNHDLRSLEHKSLTNDDEEEEKALYVSNDYKVRERVATKHRMITHVDDILGILREVEAEQPDDEAIFLIHQEDNLEELLWQLHDRGHTPRVSYQVGNITGITMYFNKRRVTIKCQQLVKSEIDGLVHITDVNCYNRCDEAMAHCNNQIFRMDHKSYYNQQDVDILNEYRTTANVGFLQGTLRSATGLVEIDMSKAYTKAFARITKVPVFNEFDVFRPYQAGEAIEDLSLYIVKGEATEKLFFNKTRNLCYGQFLKQFPNAEIIAVKKPSFIKKVNYARIVQELYESFVSCDDDEDRLLKKQIANCNFGLLEKHVNQNHKSYIFESYAEAKFYQARYGGTINYIRQYEERTVESSGQSALDNNLACDAPAYRVEFVPTDKVLYFLNISKSADMVNGFRYIKELLLQHHNYQMLLAHDALAKAGVKTYTVRTDAFTIKANDLLKAQEILRFGKEAEQSKRSTMTEVAELMDAYAKELRKNPKCPEKPTRILAKLRGKEMYDTVGKWRVSKLDHEDIKLPYENLTRKATYEFKIEAPTTTEIPITNEEEWDKDRLCEIFEKERRVLNLGEFAGAGKSAACKHMQARGHKVLFVCPTNKLCQEIMEDDKTIAAVTVNHFFGVGISDGSNIRRFDARKYDVVVFDEIFLVDTRKLAKMKHYADEHPEKIVLATGDKNQLEPVEPMTNTHTDLDAYSNHCVGMIFPKYIYLRENKRLKTAEDKQKLKDFKRDIFDEGIPIEDTVRKYFPVQKRPETKYNIAYFNDTARHVASQTRKRMGKSAEFEVGERLVCRAYLRVKKPGQKTAALFKNYEYTISEVGDDAITVVSKVAIAGDDDDYEETIDEHITLPIATVRKCFIYNYCRTCHSFQGLSIDEPITIYDWKCQWASRKWIYTAVTRARQLDQVCFKEYGDGVSDTMRLREEKEIMSYLRDKVDGYRQQDRQAGREIVPQRYITAEWLRNCLGKSCHNCGDCLIHERNERGRITSNLTAQRDNNGIAHEIENVFPMCIECNRALSNREP